MNRLLTVVMSTFLVLVTLPDAQAQDDSWPRTLPLQQGTMTIYPLQVDSKSGDVIQFRAALAWRESADSEPVFGAGWFESTVAIDGQTVHPKNLKVTQTRFPAGTEDVQAELETALANESPNWNLDFTVAELQSALKQVEAESLAGQQLNTNPPKIYYRDHPALLVSIDGDPIQREIENSTYQAVVNTPYPLIYDGQHYYLNAAKDVWYRADRATGPYRLDTSPPAAIAALVKPDEETADETAAEPVTAANAPEIIVSTQPAELIVTEGPAAFVPLVDDLLVLQNSDDDVFMHVGTQQYYVVMAGRWYHAGSLDGPWEYQASDDLPPAFARIPGNSNQADARVYVAGTEEAHDAVLDAQVPKTAAVARGEVDIDVEYDGKPDFDRVDGTDMQYAKNTGSVVIESNGLYYLVEDGVWYVSAYPDGPWQVADYRPQQVASILPSSPVYNVKYVYVYDSTPSVVYVGYTPGYLGSYVYYDTIFYGSGWHYRPWISPYYYYPRFSTWGWNVSYNSWSGWSFGFGWNWGPFYASWYSGGYWHNDHYWYGGYNGWWGPRGYRPRHYARNGYPGHRHKDYGHRDYGRGDRDHGNDGRYAAGYGNDRYGRDGQGSNYRQRDDNLYRDGRQRARMADSRDDARRSPGGDRNASGPDRVGQNPQNRSGDQKSARNGQNRSRTEPVDTRQLNAQVGPQDRTGSGKNSAGRNRTEPVTASELGDKARGRDRQVAANSGNGRNRTEPVSRSDLGDKARARDQERSGKKQAGRSRTEPVRASDLRQKAASRDVVDNGRKEMLLADSRPNDGRSSNGRQAADRAAGPSNGGRNAREGRDNSAGPSSRRLDSRTTPASTNGQRNTRAAPGDSAVNRGADRSTRSPTGVSRQARNDNSPIPLPQYRSRNNSSRQGSGAVRSAPGPRQGDSRQSRAQQPQSAAPSGRSSSAPQQRSSGQRAPERGASRSGGQRNGSSRSGSPRQGGSGRTKG